jgi:hypothetical protein
MTGNLFLNLGAYHPATRQKYFKIDKKSKNKIGAYVDIICVHTKFRIKPTFFCVLCKKDKKISCEKPFLSPKNSVIFAQDTQNVGFP